MVLQKLHILMKGSVCAHMVRYGTGFYVHSQYISTGFGHEPYFSPRNIRLLKSMTVAWGTLCDLRTSMATVTCWKARSKGLTSGRPRCRRMAPFRASAREFRAD